MGEDQPIPDEVQQKLLEFHDALNSLEELLKPFISVPLEDVESLVSFHRFRVGMRGKVRLFYLGESAFASSIASHGAFYDEFLVLE